VNGIAAASLQDLRRGLADQVGKEVSASALRGGVATKLTLRVGQWPAEGRRC
jgi:S1-C subfamily serine protease